jgi:hypothetical protein
VLKDRFKSQFGAQFGAINEYMARCHYNYANRLSNFECNEESYSQNIEYDLNLKGEVTLVPSLNNTYPKSEQIIKVAQTTVNINNKRLSDFLVSQ